MSRVSESVVFLGQANAVAISLGDPLYSADIWGALPYQSSGWLTFSPVWWERSRQLGLDGAPAMLFDNPNVLYLTSRSGAAENMRVFLGEQYGLEALACEVEIIGYLRQAWRFVPEPAGCE